MDDFERELKVSFLDEASTAITDTEQCFLALEANPEDAENLNKIFRLAHNLKGSSKAVGFDEFGAFTHEFESFILKVKNGQLKASAKVVSLLLELNDHVLHMIEGLKKDLDAKFDSADLFARMTSFSEDDAAPAIEEPVVEEAQPEVQVEQHIETVAVAAETPALHVVPAPIEVKPAPPVAKAAPTKAQNGAIDESIRVSINKVEALLNFVGEMVILQSVLTEQATKSGSELLRKTVQQIGKVSKEIQDISMSLRMLPVKPTFQKMQRIVRDTAQALNKEVNLTLIGEETELDKTVLEKINDPLVHLIRNSVDHGIENKELRLSRGKPAKGQVRLCAYHSSGKLVIEVADDGGGLDPEKLKKKATEKGILRPGATLGDKEAFDLIFAPGFSTKEQVTDVSGRGVGMDVVRTNITELGGEISISSELGKGTTFKVVLPLTLAIIESMVVTYSDRRFVIPLGSVHETLQANDKQIQNTTGLGDILMLRGENMPLFRLGDFFAIKSNTPANQMIAMVFRTGPKPFALLVDDIIGQYQVVTKQLSPDLGVIKGVSASTILGDGKPALILEPQDLLQRKLVHSFNISTDKVTDRKAA